MFRVLLSGVFALIICGQALPTWAAWEGAEVTGTVDIPGYPGQGDWPDPVATISFTDVEFVKEAVNATTSADFTENTLVLTYENTSPWPNITYGPRTYTFEVQDAVISDVTLVSSTFTFTDDIVPSFTSHSIILDMPLQNTNPGEVFTATFAVVHGPASPEEALLDMADYIWAIPEDAFKNNADNRKIALSNKILDVVDTITFAAAETDPILQNELYDEAIDKLRDDIKAKMDGCLGGNMNNDWIVDCDVQTELNELVDDIIAMVTALKN